MIKNIIFDFGNVIINWNPDEILNKYDLTQDQHNLLKKEIFQTREWIEIDAGKIDENHATEIFKNRVPNNLKQSVEEIMQTWPSRVEFYEGTFNLIKKLKQEGYHIYALSNTGMRFANYLMNTKYGQYFDGTIFSAEVKLIKPDPRIYQKLLHDYHLVAKESLFIDDIKANTDAAKKEGMQVFTFQISKLSQLEKFIDSIGKE